MYSTDELRILAKRYLEATGIAISTLGIRAASNDKLFGRLLAGLDCTARSAERGSDWFDANWPDELPWPSEITRRRSAHERVASEVEAGLPAKPAR
jgi:hypothetical protein